MTSSSSVTRSLSCRTWLAIISLILSIIIIRYYVPVQVPGPMLHPVKYRIISGSFALVLDFSRFIESIIGIPYYKVLNGIVDSFDPIKIRPFDRGQVLYHDQYIDEVLVRVYTPQNVSNPSNLPIIFFFHGGGFFFGSIYSHDTMTYHFSMYSGAKLIAINYRLTPHVRYPTPTDEGLRVARYVIDHPQEFSIDPNQVFLSGDSAGGNMAVVVERKLRADGKVKIQGVLLLYPLLQLVYYRLPSYQTFLPLRILSILEEEILTEVANFYVNSSFSREDLFLNQHLSIGDYRKFLDQLQLNQSSLDMEDPSIRVNSEKSHPEIEKLFNVDVSPLLADDDVLRKTPPTFIVACSYDVLLSDSRIYYQRLQKLNVENILYREYQIFHGVMTFVDFPVAFNEAFEIIRDSAQFVVNRTMAVK